MQQSYSRSLARFAAQLGPIGWEIASRRIERSLPPGTKFGRGWVGDGEAPPSSFQPPVLAAFSEAMAPPNDVAASGEQRPNNSGPATEDCAARSSHLAGSQAHPMPYASTSTVQRTNSEALASQQCGSIPQIPINRGEHGVEMKGSHNNLHGHPALQHTVNGFNAVPGANPSLSYTSLHNLPILMLVFVQSRQPLKLICPFSGPMMFPPAAQLVVNQMQTHTAD